jgi:hypothetical protein
MKPIIVCTLEINRWHVRINGYVVQDFHRWREKAARRFADSLKDALERGPKGEG